MRTRKCGNIRPGCVLATALSVLSACGNADSSEVIRPRGVGIDVAGQIPVEERIRYAFGTYGTGCAGRASGAAWYVVFDDAATPVGRGEPLSLLLGSEAESCELSLTGLHASVDDALQDVTPAAPPMTFTFGAPFVAANARAFETAGGDVAFYANAQLLEDSEVDPPTAILTIAFSPDPAPLSNPAEVPVEVPGP